MSNKLSQFKAGIVFALGLGISSCEMVPETDLEGNETHSSTLASPNLIYNETFEGNNPFSYLHRQFATSYAFGASQDVALEGKYSGRFELRDSDEMVASGTRSEVLFPLQSNMDRWYSFSVYLPSETFEIDSYREIISQWHQASAGSPPNALQIKDDKYILHSVDGNSKYTYHELANVTKDRWQEFVFHYKHSSGSDGIIDIWLDGEKIFSLKGGNMKKGYESPRWKVGIYKWKWNGNLKTDTDRRVLYYDNVRMGNENATFEEMTSNGGNQPIIDPDPVEGAATNLTLINTSTNLPVGDLSSGATIMAKDHRLSLLANFDEDVKPAEVKFDLSGTSDRSSVDAAAPFALNGDNGEGNYWYGEGLYPGDYELKITPYFMIDGQKTPGEEKNFAFTIISGSENAILDDPGSAPGLPEIEIQSLSLINTSTNLEVGKFSTGGYISAKDHRLSLIPNFVGETPAEMLLDLSGAANRTNLNDKAPFSLNGDNGSGNYWYGEGLYPGDYKLDITPYYELDGEKVAGEMTTFEFTIVSGNENEIIDEPDLTPGLPDFDIQSLSLINTSSNSVEGDFTSGANIIAKDHRLSIIPNFTGETPVEMLLDLSGAANRSLLSNRAPFSLNGDNGSGNYWYGEGLYPGDYQLKIIPYFDINGEKVAGDPEVFSFTITSGNSTIVN